MDKDIPGSTFKNLCTTWKLTSLLQVYIVQNELTFEKQK